MTKAEQLILRGLHLVIRTGFSPNDPIGQAKHFASLQQDIGPWLTDYVAEIVRPTDFEVDTPKLGCATTEHLLRELEARYEVSAPAGLRENVAETSDLFADLRVRFSSCAGGLSYRTVDELS